MKYKNTDKIIAEKYLSIEPDFDAQGVWKELEQKIAYKRKRRKGFWLFYAAGLLIIILFFLFQLNLGKDVNLKNNITSSTDNHNTDFSDHASGLTNSEEVVVIKELGSNFQTNNQIDSDFNSNSIQNRNGESNVIADRSLSSSLENSRKNETHEIVTNINLSNNSALSNDSGPLEFQDQNTAKIRMASSLNLLANTFNYLVYNRQKISAPELALMPPIASNTNKSKMRLGFFGGYFIHSRSIQHSGIGSTENFTSRTNEEKAIDAFDLGLKFDYFISNNLVAFGGLRLDHSYIERNADYIYLKSITLTDQIVEIVETEDGTIEKKGSVTFDGYYHHNSNNYLTNKRLGVLAGLQYRIGNDKWSSHLNLGVELPIWTKSTGIITHDGIPYNLSDGNLEINKTQPLIFGGIGAEYTLKEGVALQAMISGYLPTGNQYNESYNIIKKSTQVGINFGLHFQL